MPIKTENQTVRMPQSGKQKEKKKQQTDTQIRG